MSSQVFPARFVEIMRSAAQLVARERAYVDSSHESAELLGWQAFCDYGAHERAVWTWARDVYNSEAETGYVDAWQDYTPHEQDMLLCDAVGLPEIFRNAYRDAWGT